jgi:hypothetical protein
MSERKPKRKGKQAAPKTAAPSPGPTPAVGALVPQPHGGALRRGNPGNRGRAPGVIRQMQAAHLAEVVPKLHAEWLAGTVPSLPYAEWLAKYVLREAVTPDQLRDFLAQYERRLTAILTPDVHDAAIAAGAAAWRAVFAHQPGDDA